MGHALDEVEIPEGLPLGEQPLYLFVGPNRPGYLVRDERLLPGDPVDEADMPVAGGRGRVHRPKPTR